MASLTFEANVLSELEKSGSRHVGDIISELVCFNSCHYSKGGISTFLRSIIFLISGRNPVIATVGGFSQLAEECVTQLQLKH